MKHSQAGFTTVALIGILAVVFIGGSAYYLSQAPQESDETPKVSQEVQDSMDNGSRETDSGADTISDSDAAGGTMMAGDTRLETMTDSELAADDPALGGEVEVSQETSVTPLDSVARETGTFEAYTPEKLALAETGDVVLFFHADWCPSCRALESDINANLSQIPEGVHLLKVDYDTATELKQKYGVVRQHTLVQVDASGEKVQDLTGLNNTLDQVVSQL